MTKRLSLSYRAAAAILNCSHQTVGDLLRSGKLADLRRETIETFAQTYQPTKSGRPRGSSKTGSERPARITLSDGRELCGWQAAADATGYSIRGLRKHAEWSDDRYVIREKRGV